VCITIRKIIMLNDKAILFRCPDDLRQTLEAYAKANDLNMSQVLRRALRLFFERVESDGGL